MDTIKTYRVVLGGTINGFEQNINEQAKKGYRVVDIKIKPPHSDNGFSYMAIMKCACRIFQHGKCVECGIEIERSAI